MRTPALLALMLLGVSCSRPDRPAPPVVDLAADADLQTLLEARDYFALRSDLEKTGTNISTERKMYFRAFAESAFNHCPESIALIEALLGRTDAFPADSARVDLLLLLRDNYFKTFQYAKAARTGREALGKYKGLLGDRLHDVENTLLIHDGLSTVPAQTVDLVRTSIKWKPNTLGLIEIPIRTGQAELPIVFDTRAHISTVTASFARKLGLRILDVTYEESSGITGKKFQSGLGIADRLYIGGVLVRHAVFQVLPDEQLYFPSFKFTLQGILGFPVITQLKEVHIFKNGDFVISPTGGASALRNLAFDGSTTVLSVRQGNDTLSFHFDTGATGSEFYSTYFDRYRQSIVKEGQRHTVETGGAGGSIKIDVYALPVVDLSISDRKVVLTEVGVRTTPAFKGQRYYGNLGQDVIRQFDEMVLNFVSMYVDFK
jgi:Aspartyl protease